MPSSKVVNAVGGNGIVGLSCCFQSAQVAPALYGVNHNATMTIIANRSAAAARSTLCAQNISEPNACPIWRCDKPSNVAKHYMEKKFIDVVCATNHPVLSNLPIAT